MCVFQRVLYITTVQIIICCAAGLCSLIGGGVRFEAFRYVTSEAETTEKVVNPNVLQSSAD